MISGQMSKPEVGLESLEKEWKTVREGDPSTLESNCQGKDPSTREKESLR